MTRLTTYLKNSTCQVQSSLEIRDFQHPDQNNQSIKKNQQNASCQITTCELKMILHLTKSKIYSKCHQQQLKDISDLLSQIHQKDSAQNLLHFSHNSSQIIF